MLPIKNPQATKAAPGGIIFDAGTADFETTVMHASLTTPIIVDFWSPRSAVCKQLMPILEAAVQAAGGTVRLARINVDEHPQLAQALRVQSVPTVYAFYQGQPVNAFAGAKPAGEIKTFIDQLIHLAGGAALQTIDVAAVLKQAATALSTGDIATAQDLYSVVLEQDEKNAAAYAGLVRTFLAAGQVDEAQAFFNNIPPELVKNSNIIAAKTALDLAAQAPAGDPEKLQAAIAANPADLQARYDLALILFARGRKEEAIDALVEIIRRNRAWEEDKARKQLLTFFEALGPTDPETLAGRRKLSSVLFS